jgi:hypothetical protein
MEHRIVPVEAIDDKRVLTGVATASAVEREPDHR